MKFVNGLFVLGCVVSSKVFSMSSDVKVVSSDQVAVGKVKKDIVEVEVSNQISKKYMLSYEIARSEFLLLEHLKTCNEHGHSFPIGKLDFNIIRKYWETVPELTAARETFLQKNKALIDILEKDEKYNEIRKWYADARANGESVCHNAYRKKMSEEVYKRLQESNDDYKKARADREASLIKCNELTLKYAIGEARKVRKPLPTGWMCQHIVDKYLARLKR